MFIAMAIQKCTHPDHEWRYLTPRSRSGSRMVECIHCEQVGYEVQPAEVVSRGVQNEILF